MKRQQREAEVMGNLLAVERDESALIWTAQAQGLPSASRTMVSRTSGCLRPTEAKVARPEGLATSGRATQMMPRGRGNCITNVTLAGLAGHHSDGHHRKALYRTDGWRDEPRAWISVRWAPGQLPCGWHAKAKVLGYEAR